MYFNGTITINNNKIEFYFCNSKNKPYFSWDCNNRNGSQYVTGNAEEIRKFFNGIMEISYNSKYERYLDIELDDLGLYQN